MNYEKSKQTEQISIRLTPEFRNRIQIEAKMQSRTEANMIKAILEEYFTNIDRLQKISKLQ